MKSRGSVVFRSVLLAAVLASIGISFPALAGGDTSSWCAYMGAARSSPGAAEGSSPLLLPTQARYDVDLLGSVASGSLAL